MGILENLVDAVSESVKENFKESISDIFDNDKICLNNVCSIRLVFDPARQNNAQAYHFYGFRP